jgi:hypothetical protein
MSWRKFYLKGCSGEKESPLYRLVFGRRNMKRGMICLKVISRATFTWDEDPEIYLNSQTHGGF